MVVHPCQQHRTGRGADLMDYQLAFCDGRNVAKIAPPAEVKMRSASIWGHRLLSLALTDIREKCADIGIGDKNVKRPQSERPSRNIFFGRSNAARQILALCCLAVIVDYKKPLELDQPRRGKRLRLS